MASAEASRKEMVSAELNGVCAMAALIAATTGLESLDAIAASPSPFVRASLFSGLIINYAKAFEPAQARGKELTRSFSTRGIEGFDRKVHEALLTLRNQYLAHAGYSQNDYTLMAVKIDLHPEDQTEGGQPFASLQLGTRAQASMPVNVTPQESLRTHLKSLLRAANIKLAEAIAAHDRAFRTCDAFGDPSNSSRLESRLLASGAGKFGAPLAIPADALLVADPKVLDALPLEFVSLFFSLNPVGPNQIKLMATIKTNSSRSENSNS